MNAWKHFRTITRHRHIVMRNCFKVGLYWQGLTHDLSKYSPTEFLQGARYYQGTRSPNNAEREATGLSKSWLHHKGRNRHHFEYWIDYTLEETEDGRATGRGLGGMPMPRRYVAEMVMDRIAACVVYMGDAYTDAAPYEYFMRSADKLWFVHEDVKRDLTFLLRLLKERGKTSCFRFIRNVYLRDKNARAGLTREELEAR